ncbi:MAG: ABC transporter permease subunit [Acidobacteriota bacterium]
MKGDTARFRARARAIDRWMAGLITGGGAAVLVATLLLVLFLVIETVPLLRSPRASAEGVVPQGVPLAASEDEYRERVTVVGAEGDLHLVGRDGEVEVIPLGEVKPALEQALFSADGRFLAVIDGVGRLHALSWRQRVTWEGEKRVLQPRLRAIAATAVGDGKHLLAVVGEGNTAKVLVGSEDGASLVHLSEDGVSTTNLAVAGAAVAGALAASGAQAWIATATGLQWFQRLDPGVSLSEPTASVPLGFRPSAAAVLLGDVTVVLGGESGEVEAWQALPAAGGGWRLDHAARFQGGERVVAVAPSQREKSFLVQRVTTAEILHLTSRRTLVALPEFPPGAVLARLSQRLDGAFAVTAEGAVHRWGLQLHHPEASFATLFLPVRYEGYERADVVWQSSGGSAGFEPKLSLLPLIVGTLKGALYALLFSAPLALAGALYVNQFAPRRLREVVKPVIELMAAVPSVVVGFLAALFLAPLVREHLLISAGVLLAAPSVAAVAVVWSVAPARWQRRLSGTRELLVVLGMLVVAGTSLILLEPHLHQAWFGGDVVHWLYDRLGVSYDQRNAVVVGFALGFAVIPIIFTIAEDALSNVPPSLVAASMALGATPWEAARTVVIPAASPGLFAAVMLGLGRAVGETMIVLMATGNTPLMSMSPFNGMRTMAATIAVELPEAPYGGTLYRVLILTALLLFCFTFAINMVAAAVAERLRKRFGRLAA